LPFAEAECESLALWIRDGNDGLKRLELVVPDMSCASCLSTIERELGSLPGVHSARVNLTGKRVAVTWRGCDFDPVAVPLALQRIGYVSHPFDPAQTGLASDDAESAMLLRATAVAGFAAANIMLLSVSIWSGADEATRDLFHWISALIGLPAVVYAGRPFFRSAARVLAAGRVNMDVPISLGVILTSFMSLYETLQHGEHAYFDAAITLLFFLLAGRLLDQLMRTRARSAVAGLASLAARGATTVGPAGERACVPVHSLRSGMKIETAAGERFAADGIVVEGRSEIDRSLITGEAALSAIGPGTRVESGTLNVSGPVQVEVAAAGDDSYLAEVMRLMEAAEQAKSRYVRLADRMARFYAPAVHGLAAATLAGWLIATGGQWHSALMAAVAVLIITCPCALGLAVPAVQVVASGALFRRGVMVKDGTALERLAEIDTAVFDKTGTLTRGELKLRAAGSTQHRGLAIAAGLARSSRHPLSKAIAAAADHQGIKPELVSDIAEHPGLGLEGRWNRKPVRLGRPGWCGAPEAESAGTGAVIALSIAGERPSLLTFDDELRPGAVEAITVLKRAGVEVELLSGDSAAAVETLSRQAGIDRWRARTTPEEKLSHLQALAAAGRKVLMVGDGLNDAPALAAGHASIAPSTAADAGRMAADFVFTGVSLEAASDAHRIAVRASRIARQNIALAIGYNVLAVPIAMSGFASPLVAAVAMSTSSILVVANALRAGPGSRAAASSAREIVTAAPYPAAVGIAETP
jgi:Cu2+-exporting ATPase